MPTLGPRLALCRHRPSPRYAPAEVLARPRRSNRRRTEIRLRTVRWIPPPATSHPRQPGPGHLHPAALRPKSPCAGLTLYAVEALVDPRTGRIMNPGMAEYHVPVHADVPALDVSYLDDPDPRAPLGILGVGEGSITGVAAAIGNAVHHATGVRVRDLPITLDRLL